jgi:DNA topoisomerase VI subunit B
VGLVTAPTLRRETFATPRAAEFFELRALQAQTGQPAERFGEVIVKELVDNALDAAETAGTDPEVTISTAPAGDRCQITVADNGPGMPPELIGKVLDFSVLVSDKAAYRSPTRGLQGNALKTIVGIPHALGVREPVVVEALGVHHEIACSIDPAGQLRVDHTQTSTSRLAGTAVMVTLPAALEIGGDAARWARAFALCNPHATIAYRDNWADPPEGVSYKPTVADGWRKPLPTDPTSAHWYDPPALARLVFAHIGSARNGGKDLPLGEFVRGFAGLSSTAKAKQVCAALPTVRHLTDFEHDPAAVAALLDAMQAASRIPKPAVLGRIDESHYRARFEHWYGVRRFWFKRVQTSDGNIPWIIEVATAETERPGELHFAVNYSPTFDDPLGRLPLSAGELRTTGAKSFLRQVDAYPDGSSNRAAAIHLISPAMQFLDKGKTMLAVPDGTR